MCTILIFNFEVGYLSPYSYTMLLEIKDINTNVIAPITQATNASAKYRLVGRTTRDYFTNKIISDSTNTVIATGVRSGGTAVNFPTTAPTAHQSMVYDGTVFAWDNAISASGAANILLVSKRGDDTTGSREGYPFLTIAAALAEAEAGDVVLVYPGTYSESLTLPANVAIRGVDRSKCIISLTGRVVDTTLITMGASSVLSNITLNLASAVHVELTGVVFPGTTSATAMLQSVTLTVDNSTAGVGTSDIVGVSVLGTGDPPESFTTISDSTITVASVSSGTKSAVSAVSGSKVNIMNTNVHCTGSGPGDFIGIASGGGVVDTRHTVVAGDTTDATDSGAIIETPSRRQRYLLNFTSTGPITLDTNNSSISRVVFQGIIKQNTFAGTAGAVLFSIGTASALVGYLSDASSVGSNSAVPRIVSTPPFNSFGTFDFGLLVWAPGADLQIIFENDPTGVEGTLEVIWIGL